MKYIPNQTYDISGSYWCKKANAFIATSTKGLVQMCLGSSEARAILGKTSSSCNSCSPEECDVIMMARNDAKEDLLS